MRRTVAGAAVVVAALTATRPAVRALLGRLRGQQAAVAAMAGAGSRSEFTARLADYGVGTGAEDAAVTAVATALG